MSNQEGDEGDNAEDALRRAELDALRRFEKEADAYLRKEYPGVKTMHPPRDQVEGAYGRVGYELSNPIPVDGNWYCRRLRCPNGHPFWYHRLGSVGRGPDSHIVDRVHLLCFGRESEVILYFDMYHEEFTSLAPEGLTLEYEPAGKGTTSGRVPDFPEGLQDEQ
jgi:hypothetical protein